MSLWSMCGWRLAAGGFWTICPVVSRRGKISVILGPSGSGKSTILRLIGGLIRPRSGRVVVDGQDITRMSEKRINEVRRKLGMLFQGGALLDSYTVFDNLRRPCARRAA